MPESPRVWLLRQLLPLALLLGSLAILAQVHGTPGDDSADAAIAAGDPASRGLEIGAGDVRLSFAGVDGDPLADAASPAAAYNDTHGEYLVVWHSDDSAAGLVDDDFQIFGQRIDADTGSPVGPAIRLSDFGVGNRDFGAFHPAVAYNATDDEYLVVWEGDDEALTEGEIEIFGQRVSAAPGSFGEVGADFRISDMGTEGNTSFGAFFPAVTYNAADGEYLVVWHGDDDSGALTDGELEIFGQRLAAAPAGFGQVGINDFRISDMGASGNTSFAAFQPSVAHNPADGEYLVVWAGDDNVGALVAGEVEIFGQRLTAAPGSFGEVGVNDFRISDMGPAGNADFGAFDPSVAHNPADDEYLVVWTGDDDTGALVEGELEIFGQRLDAAAGSFGEVGANDFRISDMGPAGNADFGAFLPAVAHDAVDGEYLVVWHGEDDTGALAVGESEIFGQRLAADGSEVGGDDVRLSDMGTLDGDPRFDAQRAAVATDGDRNRALVVWHGDDDSGVLVDGEFEVYGQLLGAVADLAISKQAAAATAIPGATISYTVEAVNPGPSDLAAVQVEDLFQPPLTGCAWTCIPSGAGAACTPGPVTGDLVDSASLPAATAVTYTVTCGIDPGAVGALVNAATVTPPPGTVDPEASNNSATAVTPLVPTSDLGVSKSDGLTGAHPGDPVVYFVTVSAAGPSDAPASSVTDVFPPALLDVSWSCVATAGSSCPAAGSGDLVAGVDLLAGGSATFTASAVVAPGFVGELVNTATTAPAAGVSDPDPADNTATDVTVVTSPAELAGTMTVSGDFRVGGTVFYDVVLTNTSPHAQLDDPASDELIDLLPPELVPLGTAATGGTAVLDPDTGTVTWNGSIPGGGEVGLAIEAVIVSDPGVVISNQGEIAFDADGNGVNDSLRLTDDPQVTGGEDPTDFRVAAIVEVPAASPVGLAVLALLLMAAALVAIRRR